MNGVQFTGCTFLIDNVFIQKLIFMPIKYTFNKKKCYNFKLDFTHFDEINSISSSFFFFF